MASNLHPLTLMQRLEESYFHWAQHERLFGEEFDIEESDRRLAEIIEARAERLNVFMRNYLETLPENRRERANVRGSPSYSRHGNWSCWPIPAYWTCCWNISNPRKPAM